jgi:predicted dehydrogenase
MNTIQSDRAVSFVVIGAGDRGFTYSEYSRHFPGKMKIAAVAEPDKNRRERFANDFGLENSHVFESFEQILSMPKLADAAIIATPDDLHFRPAKMAIEKGYAVLLEKPISNRKEDIIELNSFNEKLCGFTAVCHVLRYTPFFKKLKDIADSGLLGKIVTIEHNEGVGWWHHAHSFVRGNWADTEKTSPMILAKSCHDMDLLLWFSGKQCRKISSFGSLNHFKKENAPSGSTARCTDGCKVENECPYSALKLYLDMNQNGWPVSTMTDDLSYEGRFKAIKEGPYGRCVYMCDNNAVDHQVVNAEFEDGITASFTMSAFTEPGRKIRIMGTMGEARGNGKIIETVDFRTNKKETIDIPKEENGVLTGHGGGDFGLVSAFIKAIRNENKGLISSTLDVSVESHLMAFAAEESRIHFRTITL